MSDSEKIISRGRRAEEILKDEALSEAFDSLVRDQILVIQSSNPTDTAKRESAYAMMKCVESLRMKLNAYFADGKLEERKTRGKS